MQQHNSSSETIEQIFSLFRHGRRNEIINLKTQEIKGLISNEALTEIDNKALQFKQSFLSNIKPNLNITKDCSFYISDSPRTIETFLHRISTFFPEHNELLSLTKMQLITEHNAIFDEYMYTGFVKCSERLNEYFDNNETFNSLLTNINSKLQNEPEVYKLYQSYLNLDLFVKEKYHMFLKLIYICDYYNTTSDTLNDNDIKLKYVLNELNVYRVLIDISNEDKDLNVIFNWRILSSINDEISQSDNKKKLILFSGHDYNISAMLKAFGIDYLKYDYYYNDEINFVHVKENDSHYIKLYYNNELMINPLCNSTKCPINVFTDYIKEKFNINTELYDKYSKGELKTFIDIHKQNKEM